MSLRQTRYGWFAAAVAAISVLGCGPKPLAYPSGYKQQFEKKHGGDEAKARAFVDALAALPPGQRRSYVQQHWQDARNLGLIPDSGLQDRYKSLLRAPK